MTSEAKSPGQEFQVGNVLQPITSATPRGTTVKVFSICQRHLARLLPDRGARRPGHLDPGVGDRLERAVERVRAAGLERHHERLAAGVLHGVGELEDPRVEPVEDLDADPDARLGPGVAPGPHARLGRGQQGVDVGDVGVGHPQVEAVRRALGRDDLVPLPGVSSGKVVPSQASNAALPSAAADSPYTRGEGDSSNAE